MKNKLRILLAYFRGLGFNRYNTYINYDYDYVNEWERYFEDNRGNQYSLPKSLEEIFFELINYKMKDFHKSNEYDFDEYWTLIVNVYPNENRINFQSECKFQTKEDYTYDIDLTSSNEMSRTGDKKTLSQSLLDQIEKVFNSEVDEEDERVEFDFQGSYDEIYIVDHIEVDGQLYNVRKEPWSNLLDGIMRELIDRWWADGPGISGKIEFIRNNSIKIECTFKSEDYDYTDMNINVTPENI